MLSPTAKVNIHKSMIVPILNYGSNVWYANIQCCITLEKTAKESLRCINEYRNYLNILKKCKILLLTLYLQFQDPLTMSKGLNGHYDYKFTDYICLRDS